ncbi:unnamed protein product [Allacma fusca]|uniref:Uncharacterized protein n=1 Tax=Allacma fusca TaxID=39272 RepID=A0A8J2J9S1_9HEXA|nr:unnamed protein product [Allacma fusca]
MRREIILDRNQIGKMVGATRTIPGRSFSNRDHEQNIQVIIVGLCMIIRSHTPFNCCKSRQQDNSIYAGH